MTTILASEKMIDCRKELSQEEDGQYRVSVFHPGPHGYDWDWMEYSTREEAQKVYDNVDYYEDLEKVG
jgi:hypothetical protein